MASSRKPYSDFKLVRSDGITAVIVNRNRVLLAKRSGFPLISDPGIWTFVAGHRDGNEKYAETAYREVFEETRMPREDLLLLNRFPNVMKIEKRKRIKYVNRLFVFESKDRAVKLNIENTRYRWAPLSDIKNEKEYTNIFADKLFIERVIQKALSARNKA